MLATLTLLLGLPLALASEPQSCTSLVPITFNSTTIPQLLGQWFYIAGASRYPPHLAELRAVTFEAFSFSPGSHKDELNITEIIRMNETCVVRNFSKIQVFHENSTLVHVDDNGVASTARLIQSDKDLLILNHINIDSPNLSLSARTPNVSKEHLEEFKAHLQCLGFTEQEVFYASTEHACPLPGDEDNADPQLG
ncbi:alpha-1-acid glycoprotein 1-like [Agelaius phoeniceus]|uniref:alpha-1-acid glycoprotein 1-like n=1 Tax=Agelaius phoeniceus TaxID=39638 RepID=UPI0023EAE7E0|nr:alpha-1-acid glycoprotein 1-like [Agelaius phoeniceus]